MTTGRERDTRTDHQPGLATLSTSLAHVDIALLLGIGLLGGLTALAIRRTRSTTPVAVASSALAITVALALRLGRRSGVTTAELHRALPGDDLIPRPRLVTDHALTIHAAAEEIWPWIVQMGYHRGGWYTSRWLDKLIWHIDNPSASRIVPELQRLHVGAIVPDGPPGTAFFRVAVLEPGRALVLLDDTGSHVPSTAFSWAFVLTPRDNRTTRVHVRTRGTYPPSLVLGLVSQLIVGPADFVMVSGYMLRGIKRRAEQSGQRTPIS